MRSMVEPGTVQQAKQWGYAVLPRHHPGSPGWAGLLVALCRIPAGASFAPATVDLWIRDECGLACAARLAYTGLPREAGHYIPAPAKGQSVPQSNDVEVDPRGLIYLIDRHANLDILEYTG